MTIIDSNANADANENNGNEERDLDLGNEGAGNGEGNEGQDGSKDKEHIFSDEDKLAMLDRQASRLRKKMGLEDGKGKTSAKKGKESDAPEGFDYGQKAYLIASGLKSKAEQDAAWEAVQSSGKSLDAVLESNWFQSDLAAIRTKAAMPKGQGRSGNPSGQDTVEYWLAQGDRALPPADQTKLRQAVVNARMKQKGSGSPFTNRPVVGGGK